MTVSYFSSTGRLRFEAAPFGPRKPGLMVLADDPFKPDEIIEPEPCAHFSLRSKPQTRKVLTSLSVAVLVAILTLIARS